MAMPQPQQEQQSHQQQQQPTRTVHCCEAITWLQQQPRQLAGHCFITSLPDVSELHSQTTAATVALWKPWFVAAARAVMDACADDCCAIFFQTDIKVDGVWVDKAFLVQQAAEAAGVALLWHKLVCRGPPGSVTYGKPGYHHLLAFSRQRRLQASESTSDVLPAAGLTTWSRGMGTAACRAAVKFVAQHCPGSVVVDPFCGHGSVLAVANAMGLSAVGVELSAKRARQAGRLTMGMLDAAGGGTKHSRRVQRQLKQVEQQQQQEQVQQQQEQEQVQQQEERRQADGEQQVLPDGEQQEQERQERHDRQQVQQKQSQHKDNELSQTSKAT